jgi:predicted DNA-binding protein (MmcQ/YjbR family)
MKPAVTWKALKDHAALKPGAWEDHPWGETVYKVGRKVFVFLGVADGSYGISCKLPDSAEAACTMFGFAAPTGYGLGKSGWVTARFAAKDDVPSQLLKEWIDESYAAIAPKRAPTFAGRAPKRAKASTSRAKTSEKRAKLPAKRAAAKVKRPAPS